MLRKHVTSNPRRSSRSTVTTPHWMVWPVEDDVTISFWDDCLCGCSGITQINVVQSQWKHILVSGCTRSGHLTLQDTLILEDNVLSNLFARHLKIIYVIAYFPCWIPTNLWNVTSINILLSKWNNYYSGAEPRPQFRAPSKFTRNAWNSPSNIWRVNSWAYGFMKPQDVSIS